ncbi:MAG: DUF1385 domain-containing protein [Lachnospiraceae bacterium]|nr:DUF1385 domain-containing protein [Lachnospiraceae bacterium]
MARRKVCYSGIGGQAVLEGVMMRNGDRYAVSVRKPDGEVETDVQSHRQLLAGNPVLKIPFVRGVFQFADSLSLGMKALNYSASFYDDETAQESGQSGNTGSEKAMEAIVIAISVVLALGLFVFLPTYLASLFEEHIRNDSLIALIEGGIRVAVFLLYLIAIGLMKDIRRLYGYHGAEHKCINCIESGRELTPENVMKSSRFHRRCGTSFLFFVVFISILLFIFIRVKSLPLRLLVRLLLIPVVAGIAYEILRLAGRTDGILIRILSAPGLWIQRLTTREPDRRMVETAIASVEAVFDWKAYLQEHFGEEPVETR